MIIAKSIMQEVVNSFFSMLLFSYLYLTTSCTHSDKIKISADNKTIVNISEKLDNGMLTYEDVFERDYGEYNEKDENTQEVLDGLIEKMKMNLLQNNGNVSNISIDDILLKNIDKIVNRITDAKNLKYGIYGSNGARWFVNDKNLKAPLNYFQQIFLAYASGEVLEKISREVVEKMMKTKKDYIINFGILWTVYNDKYKLETCFAKMLTYVKACEKKVHIKKQFLSQQEIRVLKEILEMEKFEQIVTTDFIEYVAKSKIISKGKDMLIGARKVLEKNAELINITKNYKAA